MSQEDFQTPILLIIFNRLNETSVVFEEIRKLKPKKLFIAADGPRPEQLDDTQKCEKTRKIIEKIDWPCEIKTLFQEKHLGCGFGPVTAVNWFFDNVEEGIILEDDCVPNQSFFYFCQELLRYYKNNEKIMHISGDNFQYGQKRGRASYYFSIYTHNWGWATWRRAWQHNRFKFLKVEAWDGLWNESVRKQKGLAILPNVNLVSNIGFNNEATHTKKTANFTNIPSQKMIFPLIHPALIWQNYLADFFTYRNTFSGSIEGFIFKKFVKLIEKPINWLKNNRTK